MGQGARAGKGTDTYLLLGGAGKEGVWLWIGPKSERDPSPLAHKHQHLMSTFRNFIIQTVCPEGSGEGHQKE